MRKIKRPYKNIKLHTGHNSSVKKPCIKDGRLYLGEGKGKGGAFPLPSIIASVTPTLISRLFGGKKKKESKIIKRKRRHYQKWLGIETIL